MACSELSKSTLTKSVFLVVNFIVWILGVALMVIGVIDRTIAHYLISDSQYIFNATNLLIATGVIVTALGLLGCVAACMKVRYLLTVYALLLLLIFVLEVLTGVYTYSKRTSIQDKTFQYLYNGTRNSYGGKDKDAVKLTHDIDWFQENLLCCGMYGPGDWQNATWYTDIGKATNETVPFSCCKVPRVIGCNVFTDLHPDNIFQDGCSTRGRRYFLKKISMVGGLIVFSSIAGVASAVLAMFLCTAFQIDEKKDYALIGSDNCK